MKTILGLVLTLLCAAVAVQASPLPAAPAAQPPAVTAAPPPPAPAVAGDPATARFLAGLDAKKAAPLFLAKTGGGGTPATGPCCDVMDQNYCAHVLCAGCRGGYASCGYGSESDLCTTCNCFC